MRFRKYTRNLELTLNGKKDKWEREDKGKNEIRERKEHVYQLSGLTRQSRFASVQYKFISLTGVCIDKMVKLMGVKSCLINSCKLSRNCVRILFLKDTKSRSNLSIDIDLFFAIFKKCTDFLNWLIEKRLTCHHFRVFWQKRYFVLKLLRPLSRKSVE